MALGTKHFNSLLVKHRFPSQRSRFDSKREKHPWKLFWCSVTVLMKSYQQVWLGLGLGYRSKQLVFACLGQNLRCGWRVGLWRRGGTYNIFGQKEFLINYEVQNSEKVCPEWILWQEKNIFTVLILSRSP